MPCAKNNFDGLHRILGDHGEKMSHTQGGISVEKFFEGPSGANVAAHRGFSVDTCDTHREAAFGTRRDSMTTFADLSTESNLLDWYGRTAEMSRRHAARQRRRASWERVNRFTSRGACSNFEGDHSTFGGDRSNFEGDRSNSRSDVEKNERAPDISVAVTTKS